jgi:hypothetical protein
VFEIIAQGPIAVWKELPLEEMPILEVVVFRGLKRATLAVIRANICADPLQFPFIRTLRIRHQHLRFYCSNICQATHVVVADHKQPFQ